MSYKKFLALLSILLLFSPIIMTDVKSEQDKELERIFLPSPLPINKSLEYVLNRRTCVRQFSEEPINNSLLSTVLWSAYGYKDDNSRTVSSINGSFAVKIYVLRKNGVYWYNPINHSLVFHQKGDFRNKAQFLAPIVIGLVWDRDLNKNEKIVGAQLGQIGQNLIISSLGLGLGTVPTNDFINPLYNIDLPINEKPKLVFPLGYPKKPSIWRCRPWYISFLPKIRDSNVKISDALNKYNINDNFDNTELNRDNISQLLWSCYGYSYYIELNNPKSFFGQRHRTVPSGHGYYPLNIYLVTSSGIYRYIHGLRHIDRFGLPIISFLWKIRSGDHRDKIAELSESYVKEAPVSIISVLNIKHTEKRGLRGDDFSSEENRWIWYYESGSCAQNSILSANVWGLSGSIAEISNKTKARSLLRLNDDFVPIFVMSFGGSK